MKNAWEIKAENYLKALTFARDELKIAKKVMDVLRAQLRALGKEPEA